MTERRPNWDDDLIESVRQTMRDNPWSVFAVIAAVEDWQVQHARDKVVMVAGNPGTYVGGLEAAIQRVRALCQESGPGWIEWLMPGVATTHIAHVSEDGYIYLPGGEGTDDFLLASARGRSWRLLSVVDIARALDGGAE